MDAGENEAPQPSLKKLGGAFVGLLQGHIELLGVELQEQKARALELFVLAGIGLILAVLILVGLSAAVVIAFWDTSPVAAIIVLCLMYAALLVTCLKRAAGLARESAHPFQATLEELARDRERLLP